MSKIYRRPMFRGGGKVSSYGNGITTGLASGGRVGLYAGGPPGSGVLFDPAVTGSFKSPPTNRQVNRSLFGGFSNPMKSGTAIVENAMNNAKTNTSNIKSGIKNIKTNIGKMDFSEKGIGQALKNVPGYLDKGVNLVKGGIKRFPAISYGLGAEYITRPQDVDKLIYEQEGYGPIEGRFRQILDPTYTSKLTDIYAQGYDEDGKLNALLKEQTEKKEVVDAANTGKETTVDINTGVPVESRKDRLKRTAKEYQEILGDGIKKDSIFDAMVAGGTSLMAGEGYASAIRGANKALDPIQNIKTASNKLALEEDIAMRKAMAVSAGKNTEMSRRIAAMREAGRTPEQIADMVAGIKPESLGEKVSKLGKVDGYAEYIKENQPDVEVVTSKVDVSKKPDGKYYIADKFTIVEVKDGAVVVGSEKIIKNS